MRHLRLLASVVAILPLVAAGPKKPYQNVNREIIVAEYWKDATPAANILPGARSHDRDEDERFEKRTFTSCAAEDLAKALMAPDMKVLGLLREHHAFSVDGQAVDLDIDAVRRFVLGAKSNPDVQNVLIFDAGFLIYVIAHEDGVTDVIIPLDPAVAAGMAQAIKG